MRECNQSAPCNEVRYCCAEVLLNLAKHGKSAPAVMYDPRLWNELLSYMRTYRQKVPDLFAVLCTLLAALVQHRQMATALKNQADRPIERLRKIRDDVERRANLNEMHLTQKKRQQHFNKLANSSCVTPQLMIRPSFLLGAEESKVLQEPMHRVDLVLRLLGQPPKYPSPTQQQQQQQVLRRSQRQPQPLQVQQRPDLSQEQPSRKSSRKSVLASGASGCYLSAKAKVTKTK